MPTTEPSGLKQLPSIDVSGHRVRDGVRLGLGCLNPDLDLSELSKNRPFRPLRLRKSCTSALFSWVSRIALSPRHNRQEPARQTPRGAPAPQELALGLRAPTGGPGGRWISHERLSCGSSCLFQLTTLGVA